MIITRKMYVFMGLMSLTSIAGQTYYPATECPLLKDNPHTTATVTPAASIAPIETYDGSTISNLPPLTSRLRDTLTVSPPFETSASVGSVAAGEGVAIAPSRATPSPAPLSQAQALTASAQKMEPQNNAATDNLTERVPEMKKDTPRSSWDAVLAKYVKAPDASGLARFDYAGLKASAKNSAILEAYVDALEGTDPDSLNENEAIAFWANLYNAVTIQIVTEAYPVSTIKKVKGGAFKTGPWKKDIITVNGRKMSLDDVEHKTLRKKYPSPLIHYMVNCASVGCPNLKDGIWAADTMEAEREAAARDYINSPRGAKITDKGLVVSSIYDWFEEDFGGNKAGVMAHLSEYAEGDLKAAIEGGVKISGYDYDWSLNE